MAVSLKHAFVSSVSDGGDTSLVRPSNWNAEHELTMAADRILGRITSGTGAAEELTASQVKTLLAIASGDVSGLGSLATASGVTVSQISDASANGRSLISAADYAAIKALLDLEIGTDVQAYDAGLTDIAALAVTDGNVIVGNGTNWVAESGTTARASLGLAIGTDVQAWDAQLDSLSSASANGVSLVTAADYAAMKGLLDLEIGTDVQAYDAGLADIAGLAVTDGNVIVGNGTNWVAESGATARTSLALGTGDSPQFTGIELGHASDTTLTRAAAGALAVEGVLVKTVGKETIWMPAVAMVARTTNGAAAGTVETTTNDVMLKSLDFDTTTQEFAQFAIRMPKSWDEGTITASFTWSHAATTTNFGVVWAIQGLSLSDGDAADTAFGTEQVIADTGGTTNDIYITSETPAVTIAGTPAAEDWVVFQVKRVPANGSDTMAIDARLHGVTLYLTTNAATDA